MMFVIEIFGEPDAQGNARLIERRTHTDRRLPKRFERLKPIYARRRRVPIVFQ